MSLDCYPFGERRIIGLEEQPMALDVAYDDNLFISVTNQCQTIIVYDLSKPDSSNLIRKFTLGSGIVLGQVNYCQAGDYLACIGHKNGLLSIYIVFNWRQIHGEELEIFELDVNVESGYQDRREKLNSIDCCQKTGNLAASFGDTVVIYKYLDDNNNNSGGNDINARSEELETGTSTTTKVDTLGEDIDSNIITNGADNLAGKRQHFEHIISIELTICALKICLLENYLSITAVDHVQVLKLELLTLQIQSDVLDLELESADGRDIYGNHEENNSGSDPSSNYNGAQSETTSTTSNTIGTTCSMISDSAATSDISSSNNNTACGEQQLNNSDLSIITMSQRHQNANYYDFDGSDAGDDNQNQSADDCITWNLNTKKLVKLPTLMHNTSKNLSSYHICHPLELLGPASESIACRVSGSIFSPDFCQNQLEPVVMLCKQFDFERDPVKSTYLKAVYLTSHEDKKRLSKPSTSQQQQHQHQQQSSASANGDNQETAQLSQVMPSAKEPTLMESSSYDLLASVTCFVTTLTTCFVYSIHGEEVARSQTITYPDLCLDLRPDLLNAYLLTPMGLQICSTGICNSTFRYDWSSSADLNLSFIATSYRTHILTTTNFIILVACSLNEHCEVEFWRKPDLMCLTKRIVHTINRCNSISIRSNLLTYLHAMSQLALLDHTGPQDLASAKGQIVGTLKTATIMLCKQLLQKKQANVITNNRIDKNIKHLLDISFCDLDELMGRKMKSSSRQDDKQVADRGFLQSSASLHSLDENSTDLEGPVSFRQMHRLARASTEPPGHMLLHDDLHPPDTDFELLKIYLKQAKFNQSILGYMISNLTDEIISKALIGYMFEYNPRLLIKCAQRFPMRLNATGSGLADQRQVKCVLFLVDKLKLLAEFYSTGIDRATVLFTLASLYNALGDRANCLSALSQIKPLNHLVITMSHNYELSQSIAKVVQEHYPDVFNLFAELAKRKKVLAARAS